MSRTFERIYPYLFAVLTAALFWYFKIKFPTGQDILAATITLGAVFTGFLATLKSMILSLQGSRIRRFKATKFFPLLMQYLREAIWSSLIFCGLGLLGFFYDPQSPPKWYGIFWVLIGTSCLITFQRVSHALVKLIQVTE